MINAVGNLFFLLLGEHHARHLYSRLPEFIASASQRARPNSEGKAEVMNLLRLGHLGPIFQDAGGHLGLKKIRLPGHGHKEPPLTRFNWLFDKNYHGHVFVIRLFEARLVDHVVVLDSRRWPSLIYDPCDPFPIVLSSTTLFECGGRKDCKVKMAEMDEVFRHRHTGEKPKQVEDKLFQLPRGSEPESMAE